MPQILGQEQNSVLSTGGVNQDNLTAIRTSRLHNEYSINGTPSIADQPAPSQLDLQGITPQGYLDNPPT